MRNGGYKGINDPSAVTGTRGIHTSRDQFELTKRFGGSWFIDTEQIIVDTAYTATNGYNTTINSSDSEGRFDAYFYINTILWSSVLRSGKFYFEVKLTAHYVGANMMITVGEESMAAGSGITVYSTTGSHFHYQTTGYFYPGGIATNIGQFATYPEYLGFAYDTDTGKFWFKANDLWSNQTGDPDLGGAGKTMYNWDVAGSGGNYRVILTHASGSGTAGGVGQYLTGQNITMTPPSGFNVH